MRVPTERSAASGAAPDTVLSAEGVAKQFGNVRVLDGVSFELRRAEVHAFIGENGAGKSTLMKLLGGYLTPSEGRLRLFGKSVILRSSDEAEALGVVLIHQEFNLAEDLSVEENIFLGRELCRGPFVRRDLMRTRASELLRELETPLDPRRRVRDLSVSQKQMVEIAKAVSRETRILIMDEPTDVLTGTETQVLFALIRRLQASGVTVVYISHKLGEVETIADRITVLRDGQLVGTYAASDLSQDEMANLMVGRELTDMFPAKEEPGSDVVFAAEGVSVPGWAEDISFELRRGEVLGLAGLVGAGRTELIEGFLGLRPRSGVLRRQGKVVTIRNPRDAAELGLAYVSEDRKGKGVLTEMALRPNLTLLALERYAAPFIDVAKEKRALSEAVETFDVRTPHLEALAGHLSGGNQQKLVLAKVMEIDPDILILDEPTRGIDVGTKRELYFFIGELVRRGKACILISSEMPEIIGLSHRVFVMRSGRMTGLLTGDAIREDELVRYATGLKTQTLQGDAHAAN